MDRAEIANLEAAGRAAMAWIPEGQDSTRPHHTLLLTAILPVAGIIAAAAVVLLALV